MFFPLSVSFYLFPYLILIFSDFYLTLFTLITALRNVFGCYYVCISAANSMKHRLTDAYRSFYAKSGKFA